MRFMLFMLPGTYDTPGPGPNLEDFRAMARFNEEMQKAGVLLDMSGLYPPAEASRVTFKAGKSTLTDGPFAEAKEIVGGYWMIQVKSRAEALEWASRIPGSDTATVEIRQIVEFNDFPDEMKEIAGEFPELKARRERLERLERS